MTVVAAGALLGLAIVAAVLAWSCHRDGDHDLALLAAGSAAVLIYAGVDLLTGA